MCPKAHPSSKPRVSRYLSRSLAKPVQRDRRVLTSAEYIAQDGPLMGDVDIVRRLARLVWPVEHFAVLRISQQDFYDALFG